MFAMSPGSILAGRYRLIDIRARGGSATVWMARDETLDRIVAVKILHPESASDTLLADRFAAEALTAATVNHPGLVAVYDTVSDPVAAIILEWVDGPDLRQRLDEGPLSATDVAAVGASLADALEALHCAGLVHRDVKPANVMFTATGLVKLTDFGIATSGSGDMTATGVVLGTAKYLSPEQVRGLDIDGRSDTYALCVVLYESLTGQTPFQRDSDMATALARLEIEPVDPRVLRPGVPAQLADAIMIGLRPNPASRWPTAAAFGAALRSLPSEPVPSPAPGATASSTMTTAVVPVRTERLWVRRRRWPRLVGYTVAAAIAVLGIYLIASGVQPLTG